MSEQSDAVLRIAVDRNNERTHRERAERALRRAQVRLAAVEAECREAVRRYDAIRSGEESGDYNAADQIEGFAQRILAALGAAVTPTPQDERPKATTPISDARASGGHMSRSHQISPADQSEGRTEGDMRYPPHAAPIRMGPPTRNTPSVTSTPEAATETPGIEAACEVMHDAYEQAAATNGWETQRASRKPWADVPEANKATMRVAVAALLSWLTPSGLQRATEQQQ